MKTRSNFLAIFGTVLVIFLVLSSCSTTKKSALACPEFSNNKPKTAKVHKKLNLNIATAYHKSTSTKQSKKVDKNAEVIGVTEKPTVNSEVSKIDIGSIANLSRTEYREVLVASTDNSVILVEDNSASYSLKPIEKIDPIKVASNNKNVKTPDEIVRPIKTSFVSENSVQTTDVPEKQMNGFAVAGFVVGLVALFIIPVGLGILAVVFGAIGLSQIKKNPNKFKGKGLAIAALILGIASVVYGFVILAGA
jgi:hypothetical protein